MSIRATYMETATTIKEKIIEIVMYFLLLII